MMTRPRMKLPEPLADLSPTTPRGMLAACVERNPSAAWDDETRADAHDVLTLRNVFFNHIMTGRDGIPTLHA